MEPTFNRKPIYENVGSTFLYFPLIVFSVTRLPFYNCSRKISDQGCLIVPLKRGEVPEFIHEIRLINVRGFWFDCVSYSDLSVRHQFDNVFHIIVYTCHYVYTVYTQQTTLSTSVFSPNPISQRCLQIIEGHCQRPGGSYCFLALQWPICDQRASTI